jgi:hypothetical protein
MRDHQAVQHLSLDNYPGSGGIGFFLLDQRTGQLADSASGAKFRTYKKGLLHH